MVDLYLGANAGGLMAQTTDGGYGFGPDARVYRFRDVVETEWQRGSVVEAAWGIWANHGGGYSYRLCSLHCLDRTVISGLTLFLKCTMQSGTLCWKSRDSWR